MNNTTEEILDESITTEELVAGPDEPIDDEDEEFVEDENGQGALFPGDAKYNQLTADINAALASVAKRGKDVAELAAFFKQWAAYEQEIDVEPELGFVILNFHIALRKCADLRSAIEDGIKQANTASDLKVERERVGAQLGYD